jgi:hypothetical protein
MLAFVIYNQRILCLCINQGESHVSHVIICFELMLALGNTRCLVVSVNGLILKGCLVV